MTGERRWLDAEATARYICVRVDALPRLVRLGRIPKPDYSMGPRSPRWDRLAIDAQFLGTAAPSGHEELVRAGVQKILASHSQRRKQR